MRVRGLSTAIRGQRSEIRKTLVGVHGLPGPKIRTWGTRHPALLMKYQFYPYAHRELAKTIAAELNLPVDRPARLNQNTLDRFLNWHLKKLKRMKL
jgi:hypothetical protein